MFVAEDGKQYMAMTMQWNSKCFVAMQGAGLGFMEEDPKSQDSGAKGNNLALVETRG
jgi:hypothetical protein